MLLVKCGTSWPSGHQLLFKDSCIPSRPLSCASHRKTKGRCAYAQAAMGNSSFEEGVGNVTFHRDSSEMPSRRATFSLSQMRAQLQTLGPAGLLSYGLLNCIYYTIGVLVVYCWVGKAPAVRGWGPAAKQMAKVFAITYVGSQITKTFTCRCSLLAKMSLQETWSPERKT
ncbi:hypothetical protein WJX74_007303 [Apatococcus lobatus]|uniref:Uncharacterized protein n=1 Tax=Apatococcus lobatus TaxID=904363 RepID=A0AAW1S7X0_9CHLO